MENFIQVLGKFINNHFSENDLNKKTRDNYSSYYNSILLFLTEREQPHITITEINQQIMEDLRVWLRKRGSLTNASRTIEVCKRALNYAKSKGMVLFNPISDFPTKRDRVKDVVHLEENELENLFKVECLSKSHDIIKDLYLFQAHTGLSFGDLHTFKIIKIEGKDWIWNKRAKNGQEYWIPLFKEAKLILTKYNGKLPKVKNRKYNMLLREITKDFDKYLTTHTARKTFATRMNDKGLSLEAIADMMGNTPQVLQKHYIKKSHRRIEAEISRLKLA